MVNEVAERCGPVRSVGLIKIEVKMGGGEAVNVGEALNTSVALYFTKCANISPII
jgi:hypothetical protein